MSLPVDTGYAEATVMNPSSSLTDFTLLVDLSKMPFSWWSAATSTDSGKLRAADGSGSELPRDVILYDDGGQTGWVRVKWSDTLSSSGTQKLRVYPPQSGLTAYSAGDMFGRHNAYDSAWHSYHPLVEDPSGTDPVFVDRTDSGHDLSTAGSMTSDDLVSGKVGNAAEFDGQDDWAEADPDTFSGPTGDTAVTLSVWVKTTQTSLGFFVQYGKPITDQGIQIVTNSEYRISIWGSSAVIGTTPDGTWTHLWGQYDPGSGELELFENDTSQGTASPTGVNFVDDGFSVAANLQPDRYVASVIDEVQMHQALRSAAWRGMEFSQSNDQDAFWNLGGGTWSWVSNTNAIRVLGAQTSTVMGTSAASVLGVS